MARGEKNTDEKNLLAVDVGNTTTRLGLFADGELVSTWELTTRERLTVDEARMKLAQALAMMGKPLPAESILACVVPTLTDVWRSALAATCGSRPLVVGPGLKTGIRMRYDDPSEVGADRVADVVAAREAYGAPVVVVDLGTTTNFEVVDGEGAFAGGIIAPGVALGARSLSAAAARLPMIELRAPAAVIGRNTRSAMQSGVVLGEVARIDGLLDAIADEKISAQIDHLEEVTRQIIDQVIQEPKKLPQIRRFLNYFLPTTLKILNAYDRMDAVGISGENIDATKAKVEAMMGTIVKAFDKQLDSLFGAEAMDISTDITVMENLLAQEGLAGPERPKTSGEGTTLEL